MYVQMYPSTHTLKSQMINIILISISTCDICQVPIRVIVCDRSLPPVEMPLKLISIDKLPHTLKVDKIYYNSI